MQKSKLSKQPKNSHGKQKTHYKIRNWKEYNDSLVRRGSLEFWIEQGLAEVWKEPDGTIVIRKRGAQKQYTDAAISLCLLVGKVFHQRLRQTEGFVRSIFRQARIVLDIPDFTTLSRRGGGLKIQIPTTAKKSVMAILDSTGLKVYGEGEWKVRKHGWSKHRTWMKIHLSIDADGEIRAALLTDNSVDDATAGRQIVADQRDDRVGAAAGDGAYDRRSMYTQCMDQHIPTILIPPQKGAKIWKHGNYHGDPHPRDKNLRAIRKSTRTQWKTTSGYHIRSLVESTMFRTKTIFGEKLNARTRANQETEVFLMMKALNMMYRGGMPESYAVT